MLVSSKWNALCRRLYIVYHAAAAPSRPMDWTKISRREVLQNCDSAKSVVKETL